MTTAATTLQGDPDNRSVSDDEVQSDHERWAFLKSDQDFIRSRESSSEILRGHRVGSYGFHAWHNAQTDSDVPIEDSRLLLMYPRTLLLTPPRHVSRDLSEIHIYDPIDPLERYQAEFFQRILAASKTRMAYQLRIGELSRLGIEEGITLNKASERDFWAFMDSARYSQRAGLVMMDNGDLRAVWKGDDGSHLALHFLGNQTVRYVIFRRRPASKYVSRVAGSDTFDGIKQRQIEGLPPGETDEAELIGDMIAECVTEVHPAVL